MRLSALFVLSISFFIVDSALSQDTLSGKCTFCDTSFYHKKAIGGEVINAYPLQVICYFSDTLGAVSTKKCVVKRYVNGERSGSEMGYYYSEKINLVNWFGKKYKKPIQPWRKKIFATEMADYSLQYKGYWRKGEKHGFWTYYDRNGKIVKVIEYKKGALVEE